MMGSPSASRLEAAVREIQQLISERFPAAVFELNEGDDPSGTYLRASVDIDDTEDVLDVVIDRLLALQIEGGLPLYVLPVWTPERLARELRQKKVSGAVCD
jgi:hypothetical protein